MTEKITGFVNVLAYMYFISYPFQKPYVDIIVKKELPLTHFIPQLWVILEADRPLLYQAFQFFCYFRVSLETYDEHGRTDQNPSRKVNPKPCYKTQHSLYWKPPSEP